MNKKLCASLLAFSCLPLMAESHLSFELNKTSYEDNLIEAQSNALSATYHHQLNDNFSLNGRFGVGVYDDDVDGMTPEAELSIDYLVSAYARFDLMPNEDFNVFATLGFNRVDFTLSSDLGNAGETESGLGYGLGAAYQFSEDYGVYLAYEQMLDDDDIEMQSYTLGFSLKF
ncbi:MAG: porin family protein [Gammaproteobacteria bacterium]|nr:porin family protein [Gammaproteobacteria bacterium]NVK88652.1 porin family protein [Gammaproteobacteria bacterium]